MTIARILAAKGRDVITTQPHWTLAEVAEVFVAKNIGAVMVVDDQGSIIGILSERDIVRVLAKRGTAVFNDAVLMHMTTKVLTTREDESIHVAMEKMTNERSRHLPVIRDERLVGLVSIGDMVKHRVLPQGEMFPNACLLPHHKCSRPTRVQPYTLSALPPKQAARDARFPLRRSERAACVPVAFYESAGSLMSRSSRCRPDSLGWLVDPRTRLWAAFRRRTFSRRCSVRRCPSR